MCKVGPVAQSWCVCIIGAGLALQRAGLAEGLHVQARDLLALHTVYIYSACELGGAVGFAC